LLGTMAYLHLTKEPDLQNDLAARMRRGQHLDFGRQLRQESKERRVVNLPLIGQTTLRPVGAVVVFVCMTFWWLTPMAPVAVAKAAIPDLSGPLIEETTSIRVVCPDGQLPIAEPPIVPIEARRLARKIPDNAGAFPLVLRAIAQDDFARARRLLIKAIAEEEMDPCQIHVGRALTAMYSGEFAEAAVWYKNAVIARPKDPELLCQAAVASIHAGDQAGALRLVVSALAAARKEGEKSNVVLATGLHIHAALNLLAGRRPEQTENYNKRAQALLAKELGPGDPRGAASYNNQAVLFALGGSLPAARGLSSWATDVWRRHDEKDPRVATGLVNQATCEYLEGLYASAREHLDDALVIRRNTVRPGTAAWALTMTQSANTDLALARYDKVRPTDVKSLVSTLEEMFRRRHCAVAVAMRTVAKSYAAESLYAPAEHYYTEALEILRQSLGPENKYLVSTLVDLAEIQLLRGRDRDAEETCLEALEIAQRTLQEDHPLVASCLAVRGRVFLSRGEPRQARPLLEKALEINRARYTDASPRLADTLALLAFSENTPQTYRDGVARYQRAIKIYENALGESSATHPAIAALSIGLARLYMDVDRHADAQPHLERAMRIRKEVLVPFHPALAETLQAQAVVLRHLQRPDRRRAADLERRAAEIRKRHAEENCRKENSAL